MNDRIFDSEFDGALDMLGDMVCIEEITNVGNSFFDCKYFGTRILILAPHPDDEINVAGNMILNLTAAKAEVFVAYSTNGDFENSAEVRASEAVNALKILGVTRQKIIFLGYGDTFNGKGKPHIFFADNKTTTSPAGHSETYAAKSFTDYAKSRRGKHSPYTRENFKRDLKDLLLELRADIIFCVDFDSHSDHRMLSLMFEESLGEILSERSDYRPEVYKKFAYSTAFTSIPDFYAPNLLQTKHPKVGVTDTYDFDLIDRANYAWENRVRFPVPELCRKTLLKGNPLADAIFAHKSQHNEWNSLRILNSDEIFFERRTDNQAFKAKVSATSGDASKVRDFKIIDTDDVDICPSKITNNLWQPDKGDDKKILSFHWVECVQVVRIVVYGNPLDEEKQRIFIRIETVNKRINFDANKISLSNTLEFNAELPEHGRPLILDIEKVFVNSVEISAVEPKENFGIAEVEFFANAEPLRKILPFVKLTVGDNFFYRYDVPFESEKISVGLYRFYVDEPVKVTATANEEKILTKILTGDDELVLNFGNEEEVVITAEVVGNPNIYDRAIIRRIGDLAQIQLKVWQWLDKMRVHKLRKFGEKNE